jgi:hypothetical protein
MLKRVLIASLFVVTGSIPFDARPSLTGQAPECNVTMPCDFSGSQVRRSRIALYPQETLGTAQHVTSSRTDMAEVNRARAQVVGDRPLRRARNENSRALTARLRRGQSARSVTTKMLSWATGRTTACRF